jgi:hypothetical protein
MLLSSNFQTLSKFLEFQTQNMQAKAKGKKPNIAVP